ncbi:Homologous-pairing protein 2 [Fulvia fulva]|uniref:Homologous-pairing protein 2 n=1 Tax=Passalora fulva TaxID=5499 RepID=A0A9Q8UVB9_PASFU|nr:Homologous-pairing protein 2 [Fulvia fulva]KAK4611734.1 Homologous-pairing protein 2 [Fulvia fulva]KAK4612378.1 Homologous-pairing protein 2 [Fulvia fulva]UJO23712.1 Homologous-pairing protein 2 [Fulvia fulva]WPV21576.1 Homologous-pairing protein 2 [Fulvia fulva]WPV36612.1 Homologous-pairing protein 2 [Fulvia fulva]
MAPTKKEATASGDKQKTLNADESAVWIKNYLRDKNRPFSAVEISGNSQGKIAKTAGVKLLKDLHEKGEIEGRNAGKQLVYHTKQEEPSEEQETKLAEMETLTTQLRDEIAAFKAEEKELRQRLREGAHVVPLPELKASIHGLEKEKRDLGARLKKLKSGDVKPVSKVEKKEVQERWSKMKKSCDARKKIRSRVWQDVVLTAESQQGKRLDAEAVEELKEELGLEF